MHGSVLFNDVFTTWNVLTGNSKSPLHHINMIIFWPCLLINHLHECSKKHTKKEQKWCRYKLSSYIIHTLWYRCTIYWYSSTQLVCHDFKNILNSLKILNFNFKIAFSFIIFILIKYFQSLFRKKLIFLKIESWCKVN